MARETVRFEISRPGIRELAKTRNMEKAMAHYADRTAEKAREIAPVRTGDYRDGIRGQVGIVDGVATGRVNATDWKSAILEFGGTHTAGEEHSHATLRHAADATGLRLEKRL